MSVAEKGSTRGADGRHAAGGHRRARRRAGGVRPGPDENGHQRHRRTRCPCQTGYRCSTPKAHHGG